MSKIRTLLREPLLHFLLIGALLFVLFGLRQNPQTEPSNRIVVDAGQVRQLALRLAGGAGLVQEPLWQCIVRAADAQAVLTRSGMVKPEARISDLSLVASFASISS